MPDQKSWSELVQPVIARCSLAASLNQDVVFHARGALALGELLRRMAEILDRGRGASVGPARGDPDQTRSN